MNIYIVRHAIAMEREEFHKFGKPDELRPLTEEGIIKMEKNVKGLVQIMSKLDLILASPLGRAQETMEIIKKKFPKVEVMTVDTLKPQAEVSKLEKDLMAMKKENVMVIGHEPHLSGFIAHLLGAKKREPFELKKGGVALIEYLGHSHHKFELKWLLTPKVLRMIGK